MTGSNGEVRMGLTSDLQVYFPNITNQNYVHTSRRTTTYNCIAWAAGINDQWWQPDPYYAYYWPEGVPRESTLAAYEAAYRTVGFEVCKDGTYEEGYEKIVIYIDASNVPQHAARLLDESTWTSKLGPFIDISHDTPEVLEGPSYGTASVYMKRGRSASSA